MRLARSLHGRLFAGLFAMLGAIWAGALTHARSSAVEAAAVDVDERLESSVSHLLRVVILSGGAAPPASDASADAPGAPASVRPPSFEIVWKGDRAPMRSADFPTGVGPTSVGFDERVDGARTWRVLTVLDAGRGITGRVALDDLSRAELARRRDQEAVRPLLWMLPLLGAAALVSVWTGLAPLRRLERAVADQDPTDPGSLGLDADAMPLELGRLTGVVERLLSRSGDVQRRQRAFTAAAGHELRTPLAGCSVQIQVAQRSVDDGERDRALALARGAIDAMDRLVRQLLVLAMAGSGEASRESVDLAALARRVVAERRQNAATAGVELHADRVAAGAIVSGDATLLETAVANLVDNAVKFSARGTTVDVELAVDAGRVALRVLDRGPGVPETERDRVFAPFHRLQPAMRPGSGLGLATVRAVVADHGGEVRLEARDGGGTKAVMELPVA